MNTQQLFGKECPPPLNTDTKAAKEPELQPLIESIIDRLRYLEPAQASDIIMFMVRQCSVYYINRIADFQSRVHEADTELKTYQEKCVPFFSMEKKLIS